MPLFIFYEVFPPQEHAQSLGFRKVSEQGDTFYPHVIAALARFDNQEASIAPVPTPKLYDLIQRLFWSVLALLVPFPGSSRSVKLYYTCLILRHALAECLRYLHQRGLYETALPYFDIAIEIYSRETENNLKYLTFLQGTAGTI